MTAQLVTRKTRFCSGPWDSRLRARPLCYKDHHVAVQRPWREAVPGTRWPGCKPVTQILRDSVCSRVTCVKWQHCYKNQTQNTCQVTLSKWLVNGSSSCSRSEHTKKRTWAVSATLPSLSPSTPAAGTNTLRVQIAWSLFTRSERNKGSDRGARPCLGRAGPHGSHQPKAPARHPSQLPPLLRGSLFSPAPVSNSAQLFWGNLPFCVTLLWHS